MIYIALLRGVNVGGKSIVNMAALKSCFEQLGFADVRTYINSGNVIFSTTQTDTIALANRIESALDKSFDPGIRVLVKTSSEISQLAAAIPLAWVNNANDKCDVLLLWPEVDSPAILDQLPTNPEVDEVRYTPGAVLWHIDRAFATKSRITRIVGTSLYKQLTIRNSNTVRKLATLANDAN